MPSATQVQCLILAVSSAAVPTLAFTNGTLVPAYICHPNADGLPKSLGQLLRFTREPVQQIGFSRNAKQNVAAPALSQQGNSKVMNSAYIIASLHDSPNNLTSINQGIVVRVSNGDSIKAGQANQLILSSGSAGVALKGALLYAQDTDGTRQGSFTDKSGANTFVLFRGCGKNPQGRVSGVIQQMGVSATENYSSLVYNAPACVENGKLIIAGLSVTGNGFGTWSYSFTVTGSDCRDDVSVASQA